MDDTTSARTASRAALALLGVAAACIALPLATLPAAHLSFSGPQLALRGAPGGAHPEAVAAIALVLPGIAVSLLRTRHRLSLQVLSSGFATATLLLLQIDVAGALREGSDRLVSSLAGPLAFTAAGDALQQLAEVRWTAAYWCALAAAGAAFALTSWALLRQPEPLREQVSPALP